MLNVNEVKIGCSYSQLKRLALWVTISADEQFEIFSCFSHKTGFDISYKLSLFSDKRKKNIINLLSAE